MLPVYKMGTVLWFQHMKRASIVGPPTAHYLQCAAAQVHGKIFRRKDKLLDRIRKGHPHILNPSPADAAREFQDSNVNWPRNYGFCQHAFTSCKFLSSSPLNIINVGNATINLVYSGWRTVQLEAQAASETQF